MPKIAKKLPRGSFMMDDTNSKIDYCPENFGKDGKQIQEGNIIKTSEDVASEWMKKCEEITNFDNSEGMFVNRKSAIDKTVKSDNHDNSNKNWQKNFSDTMKKQVQKRKRSSESLLRSLSALLTRLEADGEILQENDKRLQQLYTIQIKISQQSLQAHRQKIQALKQIHAEYIKECEETESTHQQENKRLEKELANYMLALQERLQQESRLKSIEKFRSYMESMMKDP